MRLVNALLIFGTIPFHEEKSGHRLVNIGLMQTKRIPYNTGAASGSTYDYGSAAVMASAPPALILLRLRSRLVNALLNNQVIESNDKNWNYKLRILDTGTGTNMLCIIV